MPLSSNDNDDEGVDLGQPLCPVGSDGEPDLMAGALALIKRSLVEQRRIELKAELSHKPLHGQGPDHR